MDKFYKTPEVMRQRIEKFLSEGKRFDERKLDQFREIKIETGISKKAEGSARVKIGKTEVIVGVKMDVGKPYPDSPNKGNLMVTAELTPMSSSRFEAGPPRFPAIELGRVIDRGIRESKTIELDKLCIKEGEKVWTIMVDIYSINDDGNLLDAAGIGAIVALKDAKIPKYDEEKEMVLYGQLSDKKIPMKDYIPLSITVHKIGNNFIVDPTREEEDLTETRITIGSFNGTIFSLQKGESIYLTPEEIEKILNINEKVWKDIFKNIKKFLE